MKAGQMVGSLVEKRAEWMAALWVDHLVDHWVGN